LNYLEIHVLKLLNEFYFKYNWHNFYSCFLNKLIKIKLALSSVFANSINQ